MATYRVAPTIHTLHGHFSRDLPPVLTISDGDSLLSATLDAGWSCIEQADPYGKPDKLGGRDKERDPGHALVGPIAIDGAEPGATLEVRITRVRVGRWGWTASGGFSSLVNEWLGVAGPPETALRWAIDPEAQRARDQFGRVVRTRPFLGVLGMPPDEPGVHPTGPPRFCGGNLDCRELVEGSRVFLPIPVPGGLFSFGDGHAVQGDGEVSGTAIECPMEEVELHFRLHRSLRIAMPRAETPTGWVTLGVGADMEGATQLALHGMLDLMCERSNLERRDALALASLVVDLRVTQIVNGAVGVHAFLPHGSVEFPE